MIIGFCGPKRSGKDFTASRLLELFDQDYQTLERKPIKYQTASFADPLRAFVLDVFNMDIRHSEGYLKEVPVKCLVPSHYHIKAACREYFDCIGPYPLILGYLRSIQDGGYFTKSYRELMVYIGTELIRKGISEDYWVDLMSNNTIKNEYMIISDVRMENEAKFVREQGKLIHVLNPDVKYTGEHATEMGVDKEPSDIVFYNQPSKGIQAHNLAVRELKKQLEIYYL